MGEGGGGANQSSGALAAGHRGAACLFGSSACHAGDLCPPVFLCLWFLVLFGVSWWNKTFRLLPRVLGGGGCCHRHSSGWWRLRLPSMVFGYSRPPSAVNDPIATKYRTIKTNSWKSFVWDFIQRPNTTGFPVLSYRFACILICQLSLNYYELHQEPLHCHQLEEKLDDGCRCWYFQNGIGLSCRPPDSWCRRFNVDNASLKSERFLNGPVFPDLLRDPPSLFVSNIFWFCHVMREILVCKIVHFDTNIFISIMLELGCTKFRISSSSSFYPSTSSRLSSKIPCATSPRRWGLMTITSPSQVMSPTTTSSQRLMLSSIRSP